MRRHLMAATALLFAFVAAPRGQQAPPQATAPSPPSSPDRQVPPVTFRVEVNYVEVDAVVTDQRGNFVRNLTKDDFQILEDGKPQAVSIFSVVDIPVERAERPLFARQPIEPDVQSNARPFDGRLYVLLLDDLHTDALRSRLVKAAARQFIERNLGANDLAAVVCTSGRTDASQGFTSNRRLLVAAVDKFMGRKTRSSTLERLDEYGRTAGIRQQRDPIRDPLEQERVYYARSTLSSVKQVSEFMAGIRGRRKAVLFVSEGIDYDITDFINNSGASTIVDETREAVGAATRANVNVYAIDPRGLTTMGDESIEIGGLPDDTSLHLGPESLTQELRLSQDSLRTIAEETGGFAAVNSNDFATAFQRIVDENSSYYVLGYYPTNDKRDGKVRKIQVKLNRPGLVVRSRKEYLAPRGKPPAKAAEPAGAASSPALREVLESPVQTRGLTMSVSAAPFKSTPPNVSLLLTVELAGKDLSFQEKDGKYVDNVELSYFAADPAGKVKAGDRRSVNMALKPDTYQHVARGGFRIQMRAELAPGRYQLRVGAREESGKSGSVHYDLEVPDLLKPQLAMSGVVLTSTVAGLMPTAGADPDLKDLLPAPATNVREFSRKEQLALVAEVYDNQTSQPHKVDVTTSVLSDEGKVVYKHEEEHASSELQGKPGGYGVVSRIPLSDLPPGLYVLRVAAKSRLESAPAVSRDIQFTIVE